MSLLTLPADLHRKIILGLPLASVGAISTACKALNNAVSSGAFWLARIAHDYPNISHPTIAREIAQDYYKVVYARQLGDRIRRLYNNYEDDPVYQARAERITALREQLELLEAEQGAITMERSNQAEELEAHHDAITTSISEETLRRIPRKSYSYVISPENLDAYQKKRGNQRLTFLRQLGALPVNPQGGDLVVIRWKPDEYPTLFAYYDKYSGQPFIATKFPRGLIELANEHNWTAEEFKRVYSLDFLPVLTE